MADTMCSCMNLPKIFVLEYKFVKVLVQCLSKQERAFICLHKCYSNGYLIACELLSVWRLCVKILKDNGIFHQKWK